MKKQYKIKSILHNGNIEKRNIPRTDGRYPLRIGRIVELDTKDIVTGVPLFFHYIKDENGNDYSDFYLQTSMVKDWDYVFDNRIQIETRNSIYELEEVDEIKN